MCLNSEKEVNRMKEYHKIQTVFKRDPDNMKKVMIDKNQFALSEFEYLQHNQWQLTEKVDGTNIRVMYSDGKITFGGKTDNASIPAHLYTALFDLFIPKLDLFRENFESGVCFYGEGYGEKIQSGGKYRKDQSFVLFDIKIGDWWLERNNIENIAKLFEIDVVPVLGEGTLWDMTLLCMEKQKSQWGDFPIEGIVARPLVELRKRDGSRIITKLKVKDF